MNSSPSDNPTLDLTCALIQAQSVTPEDAGCQDLLISRLEKIGFTIERLPFSDELGHVKNFWARRGTAEPCFAFAGHTDVVPVGNEARWDSPPFEPSIRDGQLYGRGAADMKASIAAFIVAVERFILANPSHKGSIALLITSDEEGPATCGTAKVIDTLEARGEKIDYCLVGEPSSTNTLGDTIKNGRRGSIGCELTVHGTQGHIAYPHLANNPIPLAANVIKTLTAIEWDEGNEYFQPTSFQFSNMHSGTGASNVIPGHASLTFNLRFSTELTDSQIKHRVDEALDQLGIEYETSWRVFGQPFLTPRGNLVDACSNAIESVCKIVPHLSTSGGTSDGRFIAPTGTQVVELGPINATIHKVNEHVPIDCLEPLAQIYERVLRNLLVT